MDSIIAGTEDVSQLSLSSPAAVTTRPGLQKMACWSISMVLSDCAGQPRLLPAQGSIYSNQEGLFNSMFILGDEPTQQSASTGPGDLRPGVRALHHLQNQRESQTQPTQQARPGYWPFVVLPKSPLQELPLRRVLSRDAASGWGRCPCLPPQP